MVKLNKFVYRFYTNSWFFIYICSNILQEQFTQVFALANEQNGGIDNTQILGEVPTLVGGEIQRISDNEQQWATQHVTIIHQGTAGQASEVQNEPSANTSYVSWSVPNNEAITTVPISISSESNLVQQVKSTIKD